MKKTAAVVALALLLAFGALVALEMMTPTAEAVQQKCFLVCQGTCCYTCCRTSTGDVICPDIACPQAFR